MTYEEYLKGRDVKLINIRDIYLNNVDKVYQQIEYTKDDFDKFEESFKILKKDILNEDDNFFIEYRDFMKNNNLNDDINDLEHFENKLNFLFKDCMRQSACINIASFSYLTMRTEIKDYVIYLDFNIWDYNTYL